MDEKVKSDLDENHASPLILSASSPSLLDGCADQTSTTGAHIERHINSHHVDVLSVSPTPTPILSPGISQPVSPFDFPVNAPSFLNPNHNHLTPPQRPNSAPPPSHLHQVSGTLLRLVGDHYMCSNCGRELRTMGDTYAAETDLRRVFRSSMDNIRFENN